MTLSMARQIVLAARPQGTPQLTDFRLEDTAIPTPAAGQLLLGVQYLSLDPYMRLLMDDRPSDATPLPLGAVMPGEAVAQVLTSHHPAYAAGDLVLAPPAGARTRSPMAPACARLIRPWRQSRPRSVCSACPGSRRMPGCG
jgi:NADPH-dependent curcumin reductase CurA